MTTRWIEGSGGDAIAMDDSHFPIIVATWFGSATEPAVRAYFAWLHALVARSASEKVPVINVTDAGPAANPSADVRRLIAELSLDLERKGGLEAFVYPAYVVIENALIRGALTAIGWMHGNMRVKNVGTCAQALDLALADLARGGHRAPPGLDPRRWRRPARP
jgi:hypothetical protein